MSAAGGILGFARRFRRAWAIATKQSRANAAFAQDMAAKEIPQAFDLATFQQALEVNVWVFAAVYRLALALSSTGYRIVKSGTDEEAKGGGADQVREVFERVNKDQTRNDFLEASFVHLALDGETYAEKAKNKLGRTRELFVLNPQHLLAVPDESGNRLVREYVYRRGTKEVHFVPDEVIACRFYNAGNPYRGMSPVAPIRNEVAADVSAARYTLNILRKGLRPGGILTPTEGDLDEAGWERLKGQIQQFNAGAENAGRLLALPAGFKFDRDSVTPRDMDFVSLRKFAREAAAAAFGVAPMMIQNFDAATYANSEQQLRAFWDYTGKPLLKKLFGALNEHWIHPEISAEISLAPDLVGIDAQIDSEKSRVQNVTSLLTGGVITINEARAKMGYARLPDGDKLLVQGALTPMDPADIQNPLAAAPAPQGQADEGDPSTSEGDDGQEPARRFFTPHRNGHSRNGHARKVRSPELDEVLRGAHEKSLSRAEEKLSRRVEGALVQLRQRILKRAGDVGGAAGADELLPNPEQEARVLLEDVTPAVLEVMREAGETALRRLGLEPEKAGAATWRVRADAWHLEHRRKVSVSSLFSLANRKVADYVDRLFTHLHKATAGLKEALRELVDRFRTGAEAGEGVSELTARIAEMPELSPLRAERIARTETISAVNTAQIEAFRAAGTARKSWLSVGDDRTRESHLEAERKTAAAPIAVEQPFVLTEEGRGTAELQFPGDPAAPAWATVHCRCALVPEQDETRAYYAARTKQELQETTR